MMTWMINILRRRQSMLRCAHKHGQISRNVTKNARKWVKSKGKMDGTHLTKFFSLFLAYSVSNIVTERNLQFTDLLIYYQQ